MATPLGNGPSSVELTPLEPHTEFSPSVSSAFVPSGLKRVFLEGGDCHCFILRVLVTGISGVMWMRTGGLALEIWEGKQKESQV